MSPIGSLPPCTCQGDGHGPAGISAGCSRHGIDKGGWKQRDKPKSSPRRSKGIRQKTKKQELLDARWAGIKDTLLFLGYGCAQANDSCYGPLDLDHKIARSKGGSYDAANGELLCRFHHSLRHGIPWQPEAS